MFFGYINCEIYKTRKQSHILNRMIKLFLQKIVLKYFVKLKKSKKKYLFLKNVFVKNFFYKGCEILKNVFNFFWRKREASQ
jgi:hypothetical protein